MYPAQVNSPATTLASGIDADDVSISVVDGSVLIAATNLLTIGTGEDAETVLMTEKNSNTLTVTRGVEGTAKAWDAGTQICRTITAYDLDAFKSNIEDLDDRVDDLEVMTTQGDIIYQGASAPARLALPNNPGYALTINSGGTAPEWAKASDGGLERWIVPAGTDLGYDDEFDDGSIDGDWVAVDVSGYSNSWYEPSGIKGMSGYFPSGKGSMKLCGMVRPFVDLTYPLYIETAIKQIGRDQQYPSVGLVFADGSTSGAGNQVIFVAAQASYYIDSSNWTNFTSRTSFQDCSRHGGSVSDRIYLRLAWSAANKFKFYYSMDGVTWIEPFAETSYTITPTHFGICQTSFDNSTYPYTGNFGYFRARSGTPANG